MSEIQKQELTSLDIKENQIENLKQIFPEVFTEGNKIDWDKLRLTLGENVDVGKERYGMNWPGKADCFKTIQQPSIATLVPDREESVNFDTTENLFIEGDNLEVLKLLQKSYLGKIKLMYFDPPYNTGGEFVYPDNYNENLETYLEYTGQKGEDGKKFQVNTDKDGRYHSKWMNMLYSRLFLARNLLSSDGVIFISIDDNEVTNLKSLCNEIFGEENFVESIIWKNKYGAGAATRGFISVHEYILCYSKQPITNIQGPLSEEEIKKHNRKDSKFYLRGPYRTQPVQTKSLGDRPNLVYPISYKGQEIWPNKQWVWSKERMNQAIAQDNVEFIEGKDGKFSIRSKQYLKDELGNLRKGKPTSLLNGPFTQEGTSELREIFNNDIFPFPKPSELIRYLVGLVINDVDSKDCIVLDIFSGSGTTAHAVMDLNKSDNGNRKFICVQLPEPTDEKSEAHKAGFKTIADISKERIRRVSSKIQNELLEVKSQKETNPTIFDDVEPSTDNQQLITKPLDLGFKVFKLQPSNFKIWDSTLEKNPEAIQAKLFEHIDHIPHEENQEAILYELLLKSGFQLTTPIETTEIEGKKVFSIADGLLLICLEKEMTLECLKAMAEMQPTRVICLDEAFEGENADALKTNAVQIMKSKGVLNFRTV